MAETPSTSAPASEAAEQPQASASETSGESSALIRETSLVSKRKDERGKFINQYRILSTLGRGSYGKVKLSIVDEEDKYYAIKVIDKRMLKRKRVGMFGNAYQDVLREIAILKKLAHENVVKLFEVMDSADDGKLYLVLEYVSNGVMYTNGSPPLDHGTLRQYARDLLQGLEYLHFQRILHRDIKPENLLITEQQTLKITDFGVSMILEGTESSQKKRGGTPAFTSPEGCTPGEQISWPSDLWAVGVTLYLCAFGKLPFYGKSIVEIYECIRGKPVEFPDGADNDFVDLVQRLLEKDPEKRATIAECKSHPWITRDGADPVPSVALEQVQVTDEEIRKAVRTVSGVVMMVRVKSRMHARLTQARRSISERKEMERRNSGIPASDEDGTGPRSTLSTSSDLLSVSTDDTEEPTSALASSTSSISSSSDALTPHARAVSVTEAGSWLAETSLSDGTPRSSTEREESDTEHNDNEHDASERRSGLSLSDCFIE